MTWLVEDPVTIVVVCLAVGVVLVVTMAQVSQRAMLLTLLAMILLTAGLLVVERLVVTEREEILATMYGAADAVRSGDYQQVQAYLAPMPAEMHARARLYLAAYRFRQIKLADMKVTTNKLTSPPSARVDLKVRAEVEARLGGGAHNAFLPHAVAELERHGDRWLVSNFREQK